jgi:hypothetical protein
MDFIKIGGGKSRFLKDGKEIKKISAIQLSKFGEQ